MLIRGHNLYNPVGHPLKVTIIFRAGLDMDNVKLPDCPVVCFVLHMPRCTVFIGVQAVDASDFSYLGIIGDLRGDCKTAFNSDAGRIHMEIYVAMRSK